VRIIKYPDSDASSLSLFPPNANTSIHAIWESKSSMLSPSLLAISAIDRNIIVVDIGNSTANPGNPKKPPMPPDVATATLCNRFDASSLGTSLRVKTVVFTALNSAA